MGLFSKNTRDRDFDVESSEPPLVTATPIDYASAGVSSSLPTPAEAISNAKITSIKIEPPLGRHPTTLPSCPHCLATHIMTRTSTYPSYETWLMCLGLLLVFWPVCWVPLVMDTAKRTDHTCSQCHGVLGTVKPMSDCCVKNS